MKIRCVCMLVVASLVAAVGLGGCGLMEPKVTSPVTGKPATGAEIVQQLNQEAEKERKQADLDLASKAAEIRRVQSEAANAATEIRASAQISAIQAEKTIAQLEVDTGARVEQATADVAAIRSRLDSRISALQTQGDAALAEVERQRSQNAGVLKFITDIPGVKAAAGSAGIDLSQAIPWLVGTPVVGGALALGRNSRKRADARADARVAEAKAQSEEKIKTHNKAWEGAQAEGLTQALLAHVLKQAAVLPATPVVPAAPASPAPTP